MRSGPVEIYRATFAARCKAMGDPGRALVDEPGVCGLLPSEESPSVRLLVTDDRAYDLLAGVLPAAQAGRIHVLAGAARCFALVGGRAGWSYDDATAMSRPDLGSVPAQPLPAELALRPVRRTADEPPDAVPLEDAVAAVLRANPASEVEPDAFAAYLRSLAPSTRLLCAVDSDGVVRATTGFSTFGTEATVFYVNTDPDWRGRGIGQTMTAVALRAARDSGARRACLDSSDLGLSVYRRLGFEPAGRVRRFALA